MYTEEDFQPLIREFLNIMNKTEQKNISEKKKIPSSIQPSQGVVIAGLMLGLFEVTSVLVDKERTINIVLSGSLE